MSSRKSPPLLRNSIPWLLASQSLAVTPLLFQLPLWLTAVALIVFFWKLQVYRGAWQMPSTLTRLALIGVCLCGLMISFTRFFGIEPMVTLLTCAVLLKQLEMRQRRDAILLVLLTYFLIAVHFLFIQSLPVALYALLCLWCNTTALLVIHQSPNNRNPKRSAALSGRLLLHSIPFMLLMFLVVPRLDPLWAVPEEVKSSVTGISDSMSPGDFSALSKSGGVAFRVAFEGERPPASQLYWRGPVFSRFDGRSWQPARPVDYYRDGSNVAWLGQKMPYWMDAKRADGKTLNYRVILEPTQQPWLFGLPLVTDFAASDDRVLGMNRDYTLVSEKTVNRRIQYRVSSALEYRLESENLPVWRRQFETYLPRRMNPRSVDLARRWRREAADESAYINRVLQLFREEFRYNIEVPTLGYHSVDDFLFKSKVGFCEHFASSFVVMMRAAGIPARVVTGYLGGEYNPLENYVVVHQYDAHAWSEVWLPGRGWTRVDPTAAVAPERIERSLGDAFPEQVESLASLGRYREFPLVGKLRLQWDAIQYRWDRAVLGFDDNTRNAFLERLLGHLNPFKVAVFLLVCGSLALAIMILHLWWHNRPQPLTPAQRFYLRVETQLRKRGFKRLPGESAERFRARVVTEAPQLSSVLGDITRYFERWYYADEAISTEKSRQLLQALRKA